MLFPEVTNSTHLTRNRSGYILHPNISNGYILKHYLFKKLETKKFKNVFGLLDNLYL